MHIHFHKYHGTGNDFILIDGRNNKVPELSPDQIKQLCHRRFGIGADGLMILRQNHDYDFEMVYYNSDGSGGTMCGNGGRCIVAFARQIGVIENHARFIASDGQHEATIDDKGEIKLKMTDVKKIRLEADYTFIHTGSPHYVKFVDNPDLIDVVTEGKKIRYSPEFMKEGTNVNFVSKSGNGIYVRTYERGVEDETYSCGTGSVASAIASYLKNKEMVTPIPIKTIGGQLQVCFEEKQDCFINVYLKGPAVLVFEGDILF